MSIMFIAWSRLSRRSRDLAELLNARLMFIPSRAPYLSAFVRTWRYLKEMKPETVFIQLPQGPLLWEVLNLSRSMKFRVVADVHTGFVYLTSLRSFILNKPFHKLLNKTALVLAHNDPQKIFMINYLKLDESKVITVYDPLPKRLNTLVKPEINGLKPQNFIVLPASWATDEPLDFVVKEFLRSRVSRDYILVITNEYNRNRNLYNKVLNIISREKAHNIVFTGYLSREKYYWLIENSIMIIAVTNREYTMLSAIWEAVAYNKPFITSETNTLRAVIGTYPCFFQMREGSLRNILDKCVYSISVNEVRTTLDRLKELSITSIEELKKLLTETSS
ncbi:MAG: hypothetical protein QXD57_04985 [Ignisphaera sp.]